MAHPDCDYTKQFEQGKQNTAANDHIHHKHGVPKTASGKAAGPAAQSKSSASFEKDSSVLGKARAAFLKVVFLIVDALLPFAIVDRLSFRAMAHPDWIPCGYRKVRAGVGEMFLFCRDAIRGQVKEIKKSCPSLPMFHLNLDLWTSNITKDKFMGVEVFAVQAPNPQDGGTE